jgi:uncharacterized coiled-coil DUF342 family protein
MPRGKTKSIQMLITEHEEKKEAYQKKIEHYQSKITEIDAQIKNLMDAQKQKELEHLMDLIREAGKTPEDIIRSLKQP